MLACSFDCSDIEPIKYFQNISINAENIKLLMISECVPHNINDYFDGSGQPSYLLNTNILFNKIGYKFQTYNDYLQNGIYLTTAIKCSKKKYVVSAKTIETCSFLLEKEIEPFTNVRVILLMGDFAIKAINYIWKRKYSHRVIPGGSTYRLRNQQYIHNGIRFFPSYTQTGDSFGIEKSKIWMMEEDVKAGMTLIL